MYLVRLSSSICLIQQNATACPLVIISMYYSVDVWEMLPCQSVLRYIAVNTVQEQTMKWDCRISWCKKDASYTSVVWVCKFLQWCSWGLCSCGMWCNTQWVISDGHFETVVVCPRVEMSVVSRCIMWIAITVTVRLNVYCQLSYSRELFCIALAFINFHEAELNGQSTLQNMWDLSGHQFCACCWWRLQLTYFSHHHALHWL